MTIINHIITDSEVLFIGPGSGSNGQSEVLNLPSLTRANCTPPTFPYGEYTTYVASLMAEGPLLCGGYYSSTLQSTCHLAGKEWTASTPMKTIRSFAAAVTLGDAWWVTGEDNLFSKGRFQLNLQKTFVCDFP